MVAETKQDRFGFTILFGDMAEGASFEIVDPEAPQAVSRYGDFPDLEPGSPGAPMALSERHLINALVKLYDIANQLGVDTALYTPDHPAIPRLRLAREWLVRNEILRRPRLYAKKKRRGSA